MEYVRKKAMIISKTRDVIIGMYRLGRLTLQIQVTNVLLTWTGAGPSLQFQLVYWA